MNPLVENRECLELSMEYEDFLEQAGSKFVEWVKGEIIMTGSANLLHQDIAGFLLGLLRWFVETHAAGKVISAPFQMWLPSVERGREPDLLFVANSSLKRLQPSHLNGAADLVIEITSAESRLRDRGEKFAEYEMEGVREYWIIDPEPQRADFFVLGTDERFTRRYPDVQGIYTSEILSGFHLEVKWLWQESLPTLREILQK